MCLLVKNVKNTNKGGSPAGIYNPVKACLCEYPEDYKYSSARFYVKNEKDWDFFGSS